MNDVVDYPCVFYPTHIVSKDKKVLPLFIGASQAVTGGYVGLYIRDEDYEKIRHDKAYILIHDPEVSDEDVIEIEWDKVEDNPDDLKTNRAHIHIWKNVDFTQRGDMK